MDFSTIALQPRPGHISLVCNSSVIHDLSVCVARVPFEEFVPPPYKVDASSHKKSGSDADYEDNDGWIHILSLISTNETAPMNVMTPVT